MDRVRWLKRMREMAEELYDYLAPEYWVTFGMGANETHRRFIRTFLERVPPRSSLLSAACGAGRYDGMLLEAGHRVLGIDQSEGMLARARVRFPEARYEKLGLQEMKFREEFDGAICVDAMEHICPEDWPVILRGFRAALKPGGWLYFTMDQSDPKSVKASYDRAKAQGLPVVYGEVADRVEDAYARVKAMPSRADTREFADSAVYHFYPQSEQARAWLAEAGFSIEEEGIGNGYQHIIARRNE